MSIVIKVRVSVPVLTGDGRVDDERERFDDESYSEVSGRSGGCRCDVLNVNILILMIMDLKMDLTFQIRYVQHVEKTWIRMEWIYLLKHSLDLMEIRNRI